MKQFILCLFDFHKLKGGKKGSDWLCTGKTFDGYELYSTQKCKFCNKIVFLDRINPYEGWSKK